MHPRVLEVTERLIARSRATREAYLALIRGAASDGPMRGKLQCANFAHGVAGCGTEDKHSLRMMNSANIAIVSSYNDMLSAHQPYEVFPQQIKNALREIGSVGQFAGGTPAMCDGVTHPFLDAGNLLAELGGTDGGNVAAGAGTDDDDVEFLGHGLPPYRSSSRRDGSSRASLMATRNSTASRPSMIRWSYDMAR